MNEMNPRSDARDSTIGWASGINLILGIWLFISPWALNYSMRQTLWNDIIVGFVVFVLSWIRLANRSTTGVASWINVVLGIWLIIAPFVFHYADPGQTWNSIIVGIIVAALGIVSGSAGVTRHGGHPAPTA